MPNPRQAVEQPLSQLAHLATEARNPASEHIDSLSTLDMLRVINDEDARVASAVAAELPQIAAAVDAIAARFAQGGRLFYIGAGTSGRLGVLDASECPPTFSVPGTLFQGLIAGGDSALRTSSEATEDLATQGAADLTAAGFGLSPTGERVPDTLIGIAASGRTPYVLGALAYARSVGDQNFVGDQTSGADPASLRALTIGLSCVAGSPVALQADIPITPLVGPEVLTGSTRMKAGTATKLVLNMLSTGVMIKTGAVYGNLMVNVQPTNAKLVDRAQRIIMAATGVDQATAADLLRRAGSVKTAIVMQELSLDRAAAEVRLSEAHGRLATALQPGLTPEQRR